jgi:hypothetical protein
MRVVKVNMKPFLPWELHEFEEGLNIDLTMGIFTMEVQLS